MMRCYVAWLSRLAFLLIASHASAAEVEFGTGACEKRVTEPAINNIVREIFEEKSLALAQKGLVSKEFWEKNKDLGFVVCDNRASYDTFVIYDKGVVFDYQMLIFLFAQSRALVVGPTISQANQFDVHQSIVRQFVEQGPELKDGPLALLDKKAIELGLDKTNLDKMYADPMFEKRQVTLFAQAIYFLVMHERCHVGLGHGTRLDEERKLPDDQRYARLQQLELDADKCAIDIINADEAQYTGSPISFFGVLMTVATQSITANSSKLRTERSHPSTRNRMDIATSRILEFVAKLPPAISERYAPTIKGTAEYFDTLLVNQANGASTK
jgi:hypothetical protein